MGAERSWPELGGELLSWAARIWDVERARAAETREEEKRKEAQRDDVREARESARLAYAVRLALIQREWVHRRVETFEFVDADTVRRRISLDFTLPDEPLMREAGRAYVPIMMLARRNLRAFDLRTADDVALSALTEEAAKTVDLDGLGQYAKDTSGPPQGARPLGRRAPTSTR